MTHKQQHNRRKARNSLLIFGLILIILAGIYAVYHDFGDVAGKAFATSTAQPTSSSTPVAAKTAGATLKLNENFDERLKVFADAGEVDGVQRMIVLNAQLNSETDGKKKDELIKQMNDYLSLNPGKNSEDAIKQANALYNNYVTYSKFVFDSSSYQAAVSAAEIDFAAKTKIKENYQAEYDRIQSEFVESKTNRDSKRTKADAVKNNPLLSLQTQRINDWLRLEQRLSETPVDDPTYNNIKDATETAKYNAGIDVIDPTLKEWFNAEADYINKDNEANEAFEKGKQIVENILSAQAALTAARAALTNAQATLTSRAAIATDFRDTTLSQRITDFQTIAPKYYEIESERDTIQRNIDAKKQERDRLRSEYDTKQTNLQTAQTNLDTKKQAADKAKSTGPGFEFTLIEAWINSENDAYQAEQNKQPDAAAKRAAAETAKQNAQKNVLSPAFKDWLDAEIEYNQRYDENEPIQNRYSQLVGEVANLESSLAQKNTELQTEKANFDAAKTAYDEAQQRYNKLAFDAILAELSVATPARAAEIRQQYSTTVENLESRKNELNIDGKTAAITNAETSLNAAVSERDNKRAAVGTKADIIEAWTSLSPEEQADPTNAAKKTEYAAALRDTKADDYIRAVDSVERNQEAANRFNLPQADAIKKWNELTDAQRTAASTSGDPNNALKTVYDAITLTGPLKFYDDALKQADAAKKTLGDSNALIIIAWNAQLGKDPSSATSDDPAVVALRDRYNTIINDKAANEYATAFTAFKDAEKALANAKAAKQNAEAELPLLEKQLEDAKKALESINEIASKIVKPPKRKVREPLEYADTFFQYLGKFQGLSAYSSIFYDEEELQDFMRRRDREWENTLKPLTVKGLVENLCEVKINLPDESTNDVLFTTSSNGLLSPAATINAVRLSSPDGKYLYKVQAIVNIPANLISVVSGNRELAPGTVGATTAQIIGKINGQDVSLVNEEGTSNPYNFLVQDGINMGGDNMIVIPYTNKKIDSVCIKFSQSINFYGKDRSVLCNNVITSQVPTLLNSGNTGNVPSGQPGSTSTPELNPLFNE